MGILASIGNELNPLLPKLIESKLALSDSIRYHMSLNGIKSIKELSKLSRLSTKKLNLILSGIYDISLIEVSKLESALNCKLIKIIHEKD